MNYRVTRIEDTELMHFGVKGQKHGVRRYQNEDGSLTAEGRDHYGVGTGDKYHNADGSLTRAGNRERRLIEKHYGQTGGKGSYDTYKANRQKKGALIGAGVGFVTGTPLFGTAVGAIIGSRVSAKRADRGREFYESEMRRLKNAE